MAELVSAVLAIASSAEEYRDPVKAALQDYGWVLLAVPVGLVIVVVAVIAKRLIRGW